MTARGAISYVIAHGILQIPILSPLKDEGTLQFSYQNNFTHHTTS